MSGGGILEVVLDELRRFGVELESGAEGIARLDVSPQFRAASAGLAGAAAADVVGQAPDQVAEVLDVVAARLRGLGAVARGNAESYDEADRGAGEWGER